MWNYFEAGHVKVPCDENTLKTLIVGTCSNRLSEAVLTSTNNLCFGAKIRKKDTPVKPQFYFIKVGCKGVFITGTCSHVGLSGTWEGLADEATRSGKAIIQDAKIFLLVGQTIKHDECRVLICFS